MNKRAFFVTFSILSVASLTGISAVLFVPNLKPFPDSTGAVATYNTAGKIDQSGAFFQSLGTNGRSCSSCHLLSQGMSLSSAGANAIYQQTRGRNPLFAAIDGANCPTDDVTKRSSHSLLLDRGLIRVGLALPAPREFSISVVHDPYGCAITYDSASGTDVVSVYRRPLPTANLRFLSAVMFDGRDTIKALTSAATYSDNLQSDLMQQALEATLHHAQAAVQPTADQLREIVGFELGLSTAQMVNWQAGMLSIHGADGGPLALSRQAYYPGSNDSLGADRAGEPFNPSAMTLFSAWDETSMPGSSEPEDGSRMRAKIAAGEKLFNTAVATITDVRGLNDNPALGSPAVIKGTCTTCHDTPNVGNHSLPLPLDIATSRQVRFESNPEIVAGLEKLSPPDLPVYEVAGCPDPQNPTVKVTFYTSDPGKALITGKCVDVNRGKGPILRGLAARAPYFHNGAAANLQQLVDFYNERFQMNFTPEQKDDLIAFLNSL
jgi:cytochrome c peroxidase